MKNAAKSVSVIMPCYFSGIILLEAIAAVLTQKNLRELILVDNGNSNYIRGKIEELVLQHHNIHVVSGQGNVGFARACNLGEKLAGGDYIALISPNCVLPKNSFVTAINALENDPIAWAVSCVLRDINNKIVPNTPSQILNFNNLLATWLGNISAPHNEKYVPAINGDFMFLRREKYSELGGMQKAYFGRLAIMDFCLKMQKMGGKIICLDTLEIKQYSNDHTHNTITASYHNAQDHLQYFRRNFRQLKTQYSLVIIALLVYLRFALQIIWLGANSFISKKNTTTNQHYLDFLGQYTDYQTQPEADKRDHKYYLTNRAPVLITDVENPIGVCILRRLLAANIEVIVLYKDQLLDIYHPKLNWLKADLGKKNLEIPSTYKIKTVICTAALYNLTPYLEKLTSYGLERVICFNPIAKVTRKSDHLIRKQLSAEQDIIRICNQRKLIYTMLHTPILYGLNCDGSIKTIYKFIARFGLFPEIADVKNVYQPVHVDDLAIAAIKILNIEATYNKTVHPKISSSTC